MRRRPGIQRTHRIDALRGEPQIFSHAQIGKQAGYLKRARDATAHAPSPGWMDVDRENLHGKITGLPKRDELVQIPINEQLIVELYSK